jgi:hypothetical protein
MATLALLQASIVAVSSDWLSVVSGKPDEKSTTILRPGTPRRFFARLRTDSSMLLAPKSASALLIEEKGEDVAADPPNGLADGESPADATCALGSTDELFAPPTAARSRSAFAVKFCTMRKVPPKSTTAMSRSGPALASMNFFAAPLA